MPIDPGVLCERELPCDARFELKLCRVMTPVKPRPFVVPVTSTSSPSRERRGADHLADLELLERFGRHRKFAQHDARLHTRLREVPGLRLRDARRAALPVRDLDGGVAVGLGRLDLGDAIVGDVENGHRDGLAVVGEHARHANLATDKSE